MARDARAGSPTAKRDGAQKDGRRVGFGRGLSVERPRQTPVLLDGAMTWTKLWFLKYVLLKLAGQDNLKSDRLEKMQGNPRVIGALNEALKEELTAINQYFLHAEMCENWHYLKLATHIKKESIAEMKHAEALMERILFLDGTPSLTEPMQIKVGGNVKVQLESDLKLEIEAVAMYNRFVDLAREAGDNGSRELFDRLLKDEEAHVDWLEAQLHQIAELGYERYLTQQLPDSE